MPSIIIYLVGTSIADTVSESLGLTKSVTIFFQAVLFTAFVFPPAKWALRLLRVLQAPQPAVGCLFFIPLAILVTVNLWFEVRMNYSAAETLCHVVNMLLVGILEELIFRGFLFKTIAKDSIKTAIIVSSVTFGI